MSNNSRSDGVVKVSFSPAAPGDCLSDKLITELARRMNLTLVEKETVGDAIVSKAPPDDTNKIWYPADENGFPIGVAYKYDPLKQQWVSTAVIVDAPPTICSGADNLLKEAGDNCWKVAKDDVEALINSLGLQISTDPGNAIRIGSDGGLWVDSAVTGVEGQLQVITPIQIASGTASDSATFDLSSIATVPSWATHAIVRARVYLDVEDMEAASTDKAYARLTVNSVIVSNVGINPGPNTTNNTGGGDSNDHYALMNGTEIDYSFILNQSPGWNAATEEGGFALELVGFVRAGI